MIEIIKRNKQVFILMGVLVASLMLIGVVSADDNLTVNETAWNLTVNETAWNLTVNETAWNVTEEQPIENVTPLYRNTEQYQTDLQYWYDYYTQDRADGYEATLRNNLKAYMQNTEMSESERWDAMLIIMGFDFRLENYLNEEKRTIDEETGSISYSLGVANWWARLFGNGTDEETLPKTIAEGDALYQIYTENYRSYLAAMKELDE